MTKPLSGIKVIELSTYVAAPGTARMLADLGADVIKVEAVGGDQWRTLGKLFLHTTDEENPFFDIYNTGKKSIAVNIKDPDGYELLLKLIGDADIFVTNTRAGSLKRLGLDADTLRAKHPCLIYASVDGYGSDGPDAGRPGFDNMAFFARSGFSADIPYKTENSYPLPATTGVGDCMTGGFLLAGINAALYNRERTGHGDTVNVSLMNVGIWAMSAMLERADPDFSGSFPLDPYSGDPLTRNYRCADGEWIDITERAYSHDAPLIYRILGVEDAVAAEHIVEENYMQKSRILIPLLEEAFLKKTSAEWLDEFRAADLVIERLVHLKDVLHDEHAAANGFVGKFRYPNGAEHMAACPPVRVGDSGCRENGTGSAPAPLLGEHTDEIMKEYGYTSAQIAEMRKKGAVK